ncbi:hypothetical protein INS49_012276 [Diaporthe citri]|uniref:uncharacterized protein n=1 Tax=Diaporthe citri TaxID=83186 RepID=UPI001C7F9F58|nr:uncharacterized protein INS49_012276 [Diaporthe citri]KAG6358757.1 hypothetical protein INS49_012276 [Diaporthe citri]
MTSATPFLTTENGATTSYLPLTTAWPSAGTDCASGVYQQIGGIFLGWDPWYAQNVDNRLSTCWPPEASAWWTQAALPTTVLGPVFTCPEAYYEAYTSTLDSHTKQTICCPSHYRLNVANFAKATFPSHLRLAPERAQCGCLQHSHSESYQQHCDRHHRGDIDTDLNLERCGFDGQKFQ